jgi:hypothetical protein
VHKKEFSKPIKIYDSFKLKEENDDKSMVEAAAKLDKKTSKRVSDVGGFAFGSKIEIKKPLLSKDDDEENNFVLINKDQV